MIGGWNTCLDACMLDLDMHCGNRIQDGLYLVKQNPEWIIFCKSESVISGITGISTGLHCS